MTNTNKRCHAMVIGGPVLLIDEVTQQDLVIVKTGRAAYRWAREHGYEIVPGSLLPEERLK